MSSPLPPHSVTVIDRKIQKRWSLANGVASLAHSFKGKRDANHANINISRPPDRKSSIALHGLAVQPPKSSAISFSNDGAMDALQTEFSKRASSASSKSGDRPSTTISDFDEEDMIEYADTAGNCVTRLDSAVKALLRCAPQDIALAFTDAVEESHAEQIDHLSELFEDIFEEAAHRVTVPPGQSIIEQGVYSGSIFRILKGTAIVRATASDGTVKEFGTVKKAGDVIGEVSFLTGTRARHTHQPSRLPISPPRWIIHQPPSR